MGRKKKTDNRWSDIDGGSAFVIPYTLLRHENFVRLSAYGNKLVMDLARQYTGFNNGYLCTSWSLMQDCGWNSSHTVHNAMLECEHYNVIMRTQQGGLNKPNLHALTWRRIDEKKGQHLDVLPTLAPPNTWKNVQPTFVLPAKKAVRSKPRNHLRRVA
jgi:hypothetical protein